MNTSVQKDGSKFHSPIKHANRMVTRDIGVNSACQTVVFLLLDNFSMVSFTGAVDVLVTSNLLTPEPIFEVVTCSVTGTKVNSDLGIDVSVNAKVEDLRSDEIDVLVICGGLRTSLRDLPLVQSLVKKCLKREIWMGGLWNGAYYLAAAGILDAHECSVHPESRELVKERYPNARISKASYLIDGKYFSCVGPNGAIRVMLDLLEKMFDADMKRGVNGILLADTNRSINSAFSNGVNFIPGKLETIIELMESNLEEPLDISELSDYTALSRRQVERLFARYLDTSPSRYYLELRLNKGRQLLLKTNHSIREVAIACGFTSPTHFSHSFKTMYGTSPTQFRFDGKDPF